MHPTSSTAYGGAASFPSLKPQSYTPLSSRAVSTFSTRRPWSEFFDISALTLPYSYPETMFRIRRNANYFRLNYTLVLLIIVFCSLVFHPISIMVFLVFFVLWMVFVFSRDSPLVVFGRVVSDRVVMAVLGLLTVVGLVFTGLGSVVFYALVIGVVVLGLHAGLRGVEDLFLDESEAAEGGLVSVVR